MSDRAPYSRVYWSIRDDPKFDGIRDDPKLVGSWLLLLIAADMAYPSPAYILPTVTRASLSRLSEAGLIDLLDGYRYRVHGLASEREHRKHLATTRGPDGHRTVTGREPLGDQAKQSKAETSKDEHSSPRDPADIYWQLTGRFPADKALSWIDSLAEKYGAEATVEALAKAHIEDPSPQSILGRTRDRLASQARKLDQAEQEAEKQRLREKRAAPRVEEPWRAEFRAALERQYGDAA